MWTPPRTLPLIVVPPPSMRWRIDLYLPTFRDIGRSFGANPGTMQTSPAVFVRGAAIGQLSKEELEKYEQQFTGSSLRTFCHEG